MYNENKNQNHSWFSRNIAERAQSDNKWCYLYMLWIEIGFILCYKWRKNHIIVIVLPELWITNYSYLNGYAVHTPNTCFYCTERILWIPNNMHTIFICTHSLIHGEKKNHWTRFFPSHMFSIPVATRSKIEYSCVLRKFNTKCTTVRAHPYKYAHNIYHRLALQAYNAILFMHITPKYTWICRLSRKKNKLIVWWLTHAPALKSIYK